MCVLATLMVAGVVVASLNENTTDEEIVAYAQGYVDNIDDCPLEGSVITMDNRTLLITIYPTQTEGWSDGWSKYEDYSLEIVGRLLQVAGKAADHVYIKYPGRIGQTAVCIFSEDWKECLGCIRLNRTEVER